MIVKREISWWNGLIMRNVIYANVSKRKTFFRRRVRGVGGWGGGGGGRVALLVSYNSPYGKASSEKGTFFKLQVYQKVDNSLVEK